MIIVYRMSEIIADGKLPRLVAKIHSGFPDPARPQGRCIIQSRHIAASGHIMGTHIKMAVYLEAHAHLETPVEFFSTDYRRRNSRARFSAHFAGICGDRIFSLPPRPHSTYGPKSNCN